MSRMASRRRTSISAPLPACIRRLRNASSWKIRPAAFAPPMRVSAGLLPNITTRSEARSASENEEACTLSYGLHLLPYMKGSATCSMWVE